MVRFPVSEPAQSVLDRANDQALRRFQTDVEPRHLLIALADPRSTPLGSVWRALGTDVENLWNAVDGSLPRIQEGAPPADAQALDFTRRCREVLDRARAEAKDAGRDETKAEDVLLALAEERGIARTLLSSAGVDAARLRDVLARGTAGPGAPIAPKTDLNTATETKPSERRAVEWRTEEPGPTEPTPDAATKPHVAAPPDPVTRPDPATPPEKPRRPRRLAPAAGPVELASILELDPADGHTLHRQIVDGVLEAVVAGILAEGQRLPSIRDAADALDVAPGTVARAYQSLDTEGVVEARGTRGTFIATVEAGPVGGAPDPLSDEWRRDLRNLVVQAALNGHGPDGIRRALESTLDDVMSGN